MIPDTVVPATCSSASSARVTTEVSIVVVSWNTRELLSRCLESIEGTVRQQGAVEAETIVVDNGSTDGTADLVRRDFPWVHLVESPNNLGFARANNLAIVRAEGNAILLLNSDTELGAGAVAELTDALRRDYTIGAVGPRMLEPDGAMQNSYGPLPSVLNEVIGPYALDPFTKPWGRFAGQAANAGRVESKGHAVDRVSFACTLVRRSAMEAVGLLDERFTFYSEDYDYFRRLKDAGWKVWYCPSAEVMHHWGGSSRQRSEWALRQLYRSKRLYFRKHHGDIAENALRLALLLRTALKATGRFVFVPLGVRRAVNGLRSDRVVARALLERVA